MKTSKRFLSIVLMLAMLVSMFTVMAFADEAVGGSGETQHCTDGHEDPKWYDDLTSCTATVAKPGYWKCGVCNGYYYEDAQGTGHNEMPTLPMYPHNLAHHDATETTREHWQCSACGKYFADANATQELTEEGLKKPTPGYEANKTIELTIAVVPNTVENAKVMLAGTQVPTGQSISIWPDMLGSFTFDASADGDYTVSWKLDNKVVSTDKSYTLPTGLQTGAHTLSVEFTKPTSEKHTLTLDITNGRYGEVYYKSGNEWKAIKDGETIKNLTKGSKIEFREYHDADCYARWTYDGTYTYESTKTVTVNESSTLYVKFIKESSSHNHNWVKKFNDTYHWKECSRCGDKTDKEKHTYIYGYDKYGYRYDKCKYCDWTSDYSYNHSSSHKDYTYEDINATYHWKTCKKCDYSVKEYHTWIKNTDRKTKDSYPYVCKYCDRLSKTAYTDLPFYDVDGNVWYYDDVLYAYINGYMDGLSAGQFAPNQNTTRAQIVTILWRLTGEPRAMKSNKFNDVSSAAYYDKAVSWAVEAGVVNGFDAKTFKPNDYVTREQLAAILYRYAEYMNLSTRGASNLTKYDDYYQIGTWARDAMAWANYHGLINGVSYTRIDPKGLATRAQVAAILHRFAVEFGNY